MKNKKFLFFCLQAFLSVALVISAITDSFAAEKNGGLRFYPMQLNYSAAESKGGVAMNVMNGTDQNFLLKGNMAAMDSDTGRFGQDNAPLPPFVILPPLARLEARGQYSFRIRQTGEGLPKDRESACIVSVTAIPAVSGPTSPSHRDMKDKAVTTSADGILSEKGSQLQIALRMNMRLFYRPVGVPERDNRTVAGQLRFRAQGDSLIVENASPYFVQLSELSLDGRKVNENTLTGYIRPKDSRRFSPGIPVKGHVEWHFTGDKESYRAMTVR